MRKRNWSGSEWKEKGWLEAGAMVAWARLLAGRGVYGFEINLEMEPTEVGDGWDVDG